MLGVGLGLAFGPLHPNYALVIVFLPVSFSLVFLSLSLYNMVQHHPAF